MTNLHGIISAYRDSPELGTLCHVRTASALTFAGRYRLVDFALSSMRLAGIRNVGVLMQKEYQSLLDHIGSGKAWDFSRKSGGITLLPPMSLNRERTGEYRGLLEALLAVETYIEQIREDYVVIMPGNLAVNLDLAAMLKEHIASGAGITAAVTNRVPNGEHHRYIVDENGTVEQTLYRRKGEGPGVVDMEVYMMEKSVLLEMIDRAAAEMRYRFHADGIAGFLERGGVMHIYRHSGYTMQINSSQDYLEANMDMLKRENRRSLFPVDRPVLTKDRADVSTYYGENAHVRNSLISDGCYIEGTVENCVIAPGVRIGKGSVLRNCIIMRDSRIGDDVQLHYVVSDKNICVRDGQQLMGSETVPVVIPRGVTA